MSEPQPEINAIQAACIIVHLERNNTKALLTQNFATQVKEKDALNGWEETAQALEANFPNMPHEDIVRVVDTLSSLRYDWMEASKHTIKEINRHLPASNHALVAQYALEQAFERLKLIGALRVSTKTMEGAFSDPSLTGSVVSPAVFDCSNQAEQETKRAIYDIVSYQNTLQRRQKKQHPHHAPK